jgi:metallo-beta-lactamase family protein
MKLHFLGAAQTVTGSQYLIEVNGHRLLLECGLFQGRRADTYERNRNFSFDPKTLDAVILSHAHIDHSGNLPNLVKNGFSGPIYATPATAHLANIMLMDSGHIQEEDVIFVNKRRAKRGEPPAEPLYTQEDAAQVAPLMAGVPYKNEFEPIPGVTAHLVDAGHILGSAAIVLDIKENGRKFRFWFSGDIGRIGMPLLKDPTFPENADYLMMESTYGDKPHRDYMLAYNEFRDAVARTVERRGKVIVPSFAVGRAQELVYALNKMIREGSIPSIPVYVDSPLAVNASNIFKLHPECFDEEAMNLIRSGKAEALDFKGLTYIRSVEESKALNERDDPMIIIAASGMAETGRILHHLKNNIENPRNTIIIVSWQSPETLGRRLADREKRVKIFGEEYSVRAEVVTIGGLSAHAGQDLLLDYVKATKPSLKQAILIHSEPSIGNIFWQKLSDVGVNKIAYPEWRSSMEI